MKLKKWLTHRTLFLTFCSLLCLQKVSAQDTGSSSPEAPTPNPSSSADKKDINSEEGEIVAETASFKISREELNRELKRQLGDQLSYFDKEALRIVETKMLGKILERELLFKEASAKNFKAKKEELDKEINKIEKSLGSKKDLNSALAEKNLDRKSLRAYIKKDIAIKAYLNAELFSKISADEKEARTYYEERQEEFVAPKQIKARHILFKIPEKEDENSLVKAKQRAEELKKEILASEKDFAEFAKEFSESPSKDKGGDLGYFSENQMVPAFSKTAFALKVGEVSDPVLTRFGYHLIKVEDIRGGEMRSYEEVKDKLLLYLKQRKQAAILKAKLEELQRKEKVITYLR